MTCEQATLLQYFCEKLARNLDLTDPHSHFRRVVPQRASASAPLLHAICAFSARHLSRTAGYDVDTSNLYYQRCIEYLVPSLTASTIILDQDLLASAIILHHLEELEMPVFIQGTRQLPSHLTVIRTYVNSQDGTPVDGSLQRAAVWTALRQEIYLAFICQCPIALSLDHFYISSLPHLPEAFEWACRAVLLCAHALNHCFGERSHDTARYRSMAAELDEWWALKPASFEPLFQSPPSGEHNFGQQIFMSDEQPTGLQHYHLARILLSAHDPQAPRCGIRKVVAQKAGDHEIRLHVRALCALAISNPGAPPHYVSACLGILMCGEKFEDELDQKAFVQILNHTESFHAWPTTSTRIYLLDAWESRRHKMEDNHTKI